MHALSVIILLVALVLPPVAFAEVETFTATHTYILGDHDSKDDARQRCLLETKRKILEQAGVYIESASEMKNFALTKDRITSFAAAVMQVKDTIENFGFENGHMTMTLTLKANVDLAEVRKQLAARQLDASVRDDVATQQERLKRLEAQFEAVQRQQGGQSSGQTPAFPPFNITVEELKTLRTQAAQGDAWAQVLLGALYETGQDVPQDYGKARQWYEKSAAQGLAIAQLNLGVLYGNGWGVPQDYAKERQWYEKAAAQGEALAQNNLGVQYFMGHGVPIDYAQAAKWFEKAASQGYAEAQIHLGFLYRKGLGVPQDYKKARQWYEKAAAQGNAKAQEYLGMLYEEVPQDYAQAAKWYEKAAAQGNMWAQFALGALYFEGTGVPQNYTKARQWWEQAVAQGDTSALVYLGHLYEDGYGVPEDDVRAYMWYSLAAAYSTSDWQKSAAEDRDRVARHMTPAQLAEAQRLSQQCQARQFKDC